MLAVIDEIREKTELSYRVICGAVRVPYPSFLRWRMRNNRKTPLIRHPGPQKIAPPDFSGLMRDILHMDHGTSRSQGAGALYGRYASSISRRDLRGMVAAARHDLNASYRRNLRRIRWNAPNVAWSIDPCEYERRDREGIKIHMTQMQDLASRYKFGPLVGECPCGAEIAGYIASVFIRFGAPLFLKRDNGGNLNHPEVNDVLEEFFVIPINSPVNYPPYNGAIEEAQKELKKGLAKTLSYKSCCPREHLEAYAGCVEHDINHQPRPCLDGKTACQAFFAGKRTFTRSERRNAYEWISNVQNDILYAQGVRPESAWRIAVEAWLNMKGLITITINGKVSPNFYRFRYH